MKRFQVIPLRIWLLSIVLLVIPILTDTVLEESLNSLLDDETSELFWLITLIPAVLFSYYLGLRGGLFIASIAIFINIVCETIEAFNGGIDLHDVRITIMVLLLHITIATSIGILADKLKNKELELVKKTTKLEKLSYVDDLTSLYNRRGFMHLSQQFMVEEPRAQAACLYIDLDEFKPVNDKYGHDMGDEVLKIIAKRLKYCVRGDDLIGRLGGDEFVCFLKNTNSKIAEQVAERMVISLSNPVEVSGLQFAGTASIGVSLSPENGESVKELLKNADIAMYEAKKRGKNQFHFFEKDPELRDTGCKI